MRVIVAAAVWSMSLCLLSGCANQSGASASSPVAHTIATSEPEKIDAGEDYLGGLWRTGPTYVAGQPTEEALRELPSRGVRAVVNIRAPQEMADRDRIPFDEQEVVESLGLAYIHLPSNNSEFAYSPNHLERLASAMNDYDGRVLLHCTVGWRASHLWAAYAHRYGGLTLDQAWASGKQMNIGSLPLEGFLGEAIELHGN